MEYTLYLYRWLRTGDDPLSPLDIVRAEEPESQWHNLTEALEARAIARYNRQDGEQWELHLADGRILPHAWEAVARNAADVAYCKLVDQETR